MEFTNRLEDILQSYKLTSSEFAEKIGVQRSSISHIMSGRNKPSLDFILKIKNAFPTLSWDWLILGEGEMFVEKSNKDDSKINEEESAEYERSVSNLTLEKIVHYYSDGTFREYKPRN